MNNLADELKEFDADVRVLYGKVRDFIGNNPLPSVVRFEEATTRSGLYEAYGKIVDLSNNVAALTNEVIVVSLKKNSYLRVLRKSGLPPTLMNMFKEIINDIKDMADLLEKMLVNYKQAVDSQLRFYGSVQYIMGSPRLSQVS